MEEKPEAKQEKIGKTEDHIGYFSYQIRNPLVFLTQTENQMLKDRKVTIRNKNLNRNTEIFWHKHWKTDQKLAKNPNVSSLQLPLLSEEN